MVLVKNMNFLPSFPFRKNKVENGFVDILDNKRALLDYKNVDLKKVENNAFLQKRLVYGFGQSLF